jgi:glycosyltransferase involved in cell wall biosynthesis
MRILSILPGPVPPPKDQKLDQAFYYPAPLCGDILLPNWATLPENITSVLGPGAYPEYRVGAFTYHFFLAGGYPPQSQRLKWDMFRFYLREGLRLSRKEKFDCILAYGWTLTGIAALILARLTHSKLIVTIPSIPQNAYRFNTYSEQFGTPRLDLTTRLAKRISEWALHFVLRRANCVRLLYPDQLSAYPKLANVPAYVLYDFVSMAGIPPVSEGDGSVLLIGAPWYVKGADLLIRAFRMVEKEFPETKLRLLGHYPGQDFKELIGDSRQIEILRARNHAETMAVLAKCSIFALASRTDAQPRVIFEAMAAGKPVIAPKVGGIPYYVQDGVTGLLFEREDVEGLARHLRTLLASPELRFQLGQAGLKIARTQYDEVTLGRRLLDMVERTVKGQGLAPALPAEVRHNALSNQ